MEKKSNEIIENLEKSFKERDFKKRIIVCADRYIQRWFYCGLTLGECHFTADDIIQILVEKVLNNEIKWDKEKYPNFNNFLMSNIHSVVSNEFNRKSDSEIFLNSIQDVDNTENIFGENDYDKDKDLHLSDEELRKKVDDVLNGDDECVLVYDSWRCGMKTKEIAEDLGISDKEVEKIKKRIRYKLQKSKIKEILKTRYEKSRGQQT